MSSGATAQDKTWKDRESASEASYINDKEREQLEAIRAKLGESTSSNEATSTVPREDRPYEAGFGGQEDLEDRYATTSGEH
ncbi:hypothetical protein FA13DRAFT_1787390 [Coprinellus micaceus]|uniref:Uncharacterized protein n=1 Tax=Coprinellus micaceus TaxID=71717 RepID=A0A4Y7TPT0_COPMI|nr:hypothetical protein FA13DRAFT_1787390 [Coprinellus micaceus]